MHLTISGTPETLFSVSSAVEAELEKAILKADGMLASNFGNLHRLGWARSSRTDKGVRPGL